MRRIAHIINPVDVGLESDLGVAQPVTFESMRRARAFAADHLDVELWCTCYPEDRRVAPRDFQVAPDLDRSLMDLGEFPEQKKLPLLADILQRVYESSDAEYLIYTNVDIALQPHMYATVNQIIDRGHDAFTINRRTISERYKRVEDLPRMWSQVGMPHRGHDCFIFHRDLYPKLRLGQIAVGVRFVGLVLLLNLIFHARRFSEFRKLHATFHIGNQRRWRDRSYDAFSAHNRAQCQAALEALAAQFGRPGDPDLYDQYVSVLHRNEPWWNRWLPNWVNGRK